ncbi:MAG: NfeD family protein, partial [Chloroflexota bacterium]
GAAFVLFILELKAAAHGALTVVGAISFVIGALVLFNSADTPDFQQVSLPLVIATALIIAGTFAFGVGFALRAQSVPIQMGKEFLVGQTGIVRVALDPRGQVQVAGELWSAENVDGERAIPVGARVEVIGMNGIYVRVRSIPLSDKV